MGDRCPRVKGAAARAAPGLVNRGATVKRASALFFGWARRPSPLEQSGGPAVSAGAE